ncbi:alpha/beta hydrolase [soil metagenome]
MKMLIRLLAIALTAYLALLALLFVRQRDLVFPRGPARADIAQAGLGGAQEVKLTAADGERLVAWVVPPRRGRPVILYFHGNAGNLGRPGRVGRFKALTEDGTGLLAVSYRGYGGSNGTPSEAGLHLDARAPYGAAAERFGAAQLICYGESLGTGIVLKLAAEAPLAGLVLEAPYLSTLSVAQGVYPYVPVALLMLDTFRSDLAIGRVRAPLLVLHGQRDRVIPFAQGETLYGLANAPKRFLRFPKGGHEELPAHGSLPEIRRFLADLANGAVTAAESRTVE